ncbi:MULTISPECIES: DUF1641 domain-containing protein [Sulfolobaceae]|uniref:DUF1641 domain-containing protein n=1 Tax=Sulfolobaceae TaxID=118883 RepID=UPI0009F4CEBC|nr:MULTISPECIES: DUF1641 domain-containing protein [unclassified Sulfolobus]
MTENIIELDSLLANEKLNVTNKVLEVMIDIDKLGLVDLVKGILEDEKTFGKIVSMITSDEMLNFFLNSGKLLNVLNKLLLDDENLDVILQLVDVANKAKKIGLIDLLQGILSDEKYLGKIINGIVNDNLLNIVSRWDSILALANNLTTEDMLNTINTILSLMEDLNKVGILDVIRGIIKDENTLGNIINGLVNDFTLNLLNNWKEIANDLSKIDLRNFKYYTWLVSATGEALKVENVQPVTSLWELYRLFRDKDVQRGLGVVVSVLRHIGKVYEPEKGLAYQDIKI